MLQPEQQVFVNFELALPSELFNFKWLHSESSFKNIFGQFPKDKITLQNLMKGGFNKLEHVFFNDGIS